MEMKLKIDVKVEPEGDLLEELRGLSPERFLRAWAIFTKNLARNNAQKAASGSGGRSFWQREILQSIHDSVGADSATVYSDSYIAEHVHTGGVIRPRTRKYLAIPLDPRLKKKGPGDVAWRTPDKEPVFLPRKRGPGWVMMDYAGRGKRKYLEPKFALVPETLPQRPRPWWPSDEDIEKETRRFFEEDL